LQGVAGAGLIPLSQATLLQINPPERHGQAMAVFGIGTVLGPIMGPALGGWLTYDYSWRWVFYINLPVGVLCTLGHPVSIVRQHWLSRLPGSARCRLGLGPGAPLGPRPSQPSPLRLHGERGSPRCDRA
jgi:MFS family permease